MKKTIQVQVRGSRFISTSFSSKIFSGSFAAAHIDMQTMYHTEKYIMEAWDLNEINLFNAATHTVKVHTAAAVSSPRH